MAGVVKATIAWGDARRACHQKKQNDLLDEFREAREREDTAEVWRTVRLMTSTNLGPKKRAYLYRGHFMPSTQEMADYVGSHPAQGGQSMTITEPQEDLPPPHPTFCWRDT